MQSGLERAKVRLTGNEMQKFLQKMSEPQFSKKLTELLRTGNNIKISQFLKKNGFKLG